MYTILSDTQKVNDVVIPTFCRQVTGADTELLIEAGTTGFTGSNKREAGGRTYIGIGCEAGDFHFFPMRDDDDRIIGMGIACCGDAGLAAIMKALEFAHKAIEDQICDVDD